MNNDLIIEKIEHKGLKIELHELKKGYRNDEKNNALYYNFIPTLSIAIEVNGVIKSNPNAKLLFKYNEDLTKHTVICEFYNNALEYAKSIIDELKCGINPQIN